MNFLQTNYSNTTEVSKCHVFYTVVIGIFGSAICSIGICGNIISLLIVRKFGNLSATFFLLRSLAITDTIILIGYVLNLLLMEYLDYMDLILEVYYSEYQYVFMYVIFPIYSMSVTLAAWITCLLTIHR